MVFSVQGAKHHGLRKRTQKARALAFFSSRLSDSRVQPQPWARSLKATNANTVRSLQIYPASAHRFCLFMEVCSIGGSPHLLYHLDLDGNNFQGCLVTLDCLSPIPSVCYCVLTLWQIFLFLGFGPKAWLIRVFCVYYWLFLFFFLEICFFFPFYRHSSVDILFLSASVTRSSLMNCKF